MPIVPITKATIAMLTVFVAFAPSLGVSQKLRQNFHELFTGFDMEQRIAYRIGQVGCLKDLFYGKKTDIYIGLGSLHRGNYSHNVSRFALKQRIAFLLGQFNCLRLHLKIDHLDVRNESKMVPPDSNLGRHNSSDVVPESNSTINNQLQGTPLINFNYYILRSHYDHYYMFSQSTLTARMPIRKVILLMVST